MGYPHTYPHTTNDQWEEISQTIIKQPESSKNNARKKEY